MPTLIRRSLRGAFRLLLTSVGKLIAIPVRWRLRQFLAATCDPVSIQQALLQSIITRQAPTAFGRDYGFDLIKTAADFRRQLPVAGYEAFEPYLNRVRKGETAALLTDPHIHMFALTSGTTATPKYIPVNDQYLADYRRGWNIWGLKVYLDHPEVKFRPILQLSGDWDEHRTEAGTPCGAVTGLTATMQKRIVRWLYCVPPCAGKVKDAAAKYYLALRLSMPREVSMIIAANPSTLINLARAGDNEKESLIRDIHDGTLSPRFAIPEEVRAGVRCRLRRDRSRARELERIVSRTGTLYPKDYWPRRCLLGNWTGGSVGVYLPHYPRYYGNHTVRDVGLIASEGRMTIPLTDGSPAGVLDVTSHYYEFIPEADGDRPNPTVLGAHELQEGGRYFILLTTAYGLYRYHIHDLVRVAGFFNKTPLIEFLSKGAHFSSLTGEKLSEYQVTQAMTQLLRDLDLSFTTYGVAPCWPNGSSTTDFEQPYYGLFVERGDVSGEDVGKRLAERLDGRLRELNVEYASKRDSGRLGAVRLEAVPAGFWARWDRERLRTTGGALEQYKHPCLIPDPKFAEQAHACANLGPAVGLTS
jgi:hypothetical protein